ncbi:hypothetical protein MRX96_017277 [Rhipicephalus microplus]
MNSTAPASYSHWAFKGRTKPSPRPLGGSGCGGKNGVNEHGLFFCFAGCWHSSDTVRIFLSSTCTSPSVRRRSHKLRCACAQLPCDEFYRTCAVQPLGFLKGGPSHHRDHLAAAVAAERTA